MESNIGGEDWPVANGRDPVNDGKYHVIRLRRQSSSMFLQLDNKEWSNSTAPGNSHIASQSKEGYHNKRRLSSLAL